MPNSLQLKRTTKLSSQMTNAINDVTSDVLVIIPAYNEAKNLEKAVKNLINETNLDFIIIDDCSTDDTSKIIEKHHWNHIINSKNLGLSKSFVEGIKFAQKNGYKYVVQYDGDGQHNPSDILKMIWYATKGYDIIVSSRYYSKNELTNAKKTAHKILNFLFKLKTHQKITDATCGLRLYNWLVMDEFLKNNKMEVEPAAIAYVTKKRNLKIKEVDTITFNREFGEGSFNKKSKIIKYMTKQIFKLIFLSSNGGKIHE